MDDPSARQTPESWPTTLDRVLRGSYLDEQALANGRLDIPVRRLLVLGVALGAIYGICLGTFRMFRGGDHATQQMLASALKVPSLFMLTLLVTFPSLYVFTALQRLLARYPGYNDAVAQFIAADPLAPLRERALLRYRALAAMSG